VTVNRTVDEVAQALRDSRGLVTHAAERLGISRVALSKRIKNHPSLQEVRDESREAMTDLAEHSLHTAIQTGESWAVLFYLKTQGRERGYVERLEEKREMTGDIRVTIRTVDDRGDPSTSGE
jgi:predicted transcriptional regulator